MDDKINNFSLLESGTSQCPHGGKCLRRLPLMSGKLCFKQRKTDYVECIARTLVIFITTYVSFRFLFTPPNFARIDIMTGMDTRPLCHAKLSQVKLEAHIMSKCPDARDCMRDLILPAMQEISDDVAFTLSYIGKNTEGDDAVECMHGQAECLGNMIQLCAATYYHDPKIYLGFSMCMMKQYSAIPEKSLVRECALEHGIDFKVLNDCASDEAIGMDLLRNSVARSAQANVTTSCTVRLNEKVRCIRDGGQWKNCTGGSTPEDLIRDIRSLMSSRDTAL